MQIPDTISQNNMPYKELEKLGINRELADALPKDFKNRLLAGEITPVMQARIPTGDGRVMLIPVKLQLAKDDCNNLQLVTYPVRREVSQTTLNQLGLTNEQERLNKGEIFSRKMAMQDGTVKDVFIQMDPETKSVLIRKSEDILMKERLTEVSKIKDIGLGSEQMERAALGKPVELKVGDQKVSVGVDLKEPQGFKVVKGDFNEWKRQQDIRYDVAHPEFVGIVQTDRNRWEYQKIVDKQSTERAIKLDPSEKRSESNGLKL